MLHSIPSYEKYSYTPFIVFASTANRKTLIQAMRESTCNEMLFNVTTLQNIHAIPLSSLFFFFYDEPLNPRLKCKILKDRSISRFLESRERERGRDLHKGRLKATPDNVESWRGSRRGTNLNGAASGSINNCSRTTIADYISLVIAYPPRELARGR